LAFSDIDFDTWLLLGALVVVLAMLAVLILKRPGQGDENAELLAARADREKWREEAETAARDLAVAQTVIEERDRLRVDLGELDKAHAKLASDHAALTARHEASALHHEEKLADLEQARKQLTESFKLTANEILKTSGEQLNKQGTENLQTLLKPLREQLKGFQENVIKDAEKRVDQTTEIRTMIKTLHGDARQMSDDAKSLTNALRSSSKVQGDWGELVLATILERAGLREGEEYFTQETKSTEDGTRRRPDVVVDMPGKQRLVIDSKVSLTAFERCVNAEDDDERGVALKQHITSMRAHIKGLGDKDYASLYEGVSFTLMFIPLEGAASLALQNDPEIAIYAWERDVMIATPTTLMMAMRTVQNLWTIDRQNQNARQIADRAGKLYDKFEGFVGDLEKIGMRIGQASDAWHDAKGKLTEGAGNLVRQTEQLKSLGAKTKKALPDEYLEAAGVEDEQKALAAPEAVES
jgi:DNA recombination protein RmuC